MDSTRTVARYRDVLRRLDEDEITYLRAAELLTALSAEAVEQSALASTLPAPPDVAPTVTPTPVPEVEADADDLYFKSLPCKPSVLRARVLYLGKRLGLTPEVVARTGTIFDHLGSDERKTFVVLMAYGYCLDVRGCGRPLRENEICHCENDE